MYTWAGDKKDSHVVFDFVKKIMALENDRKHYTIAFSIEAKMIAFRGKIALDGIWC